MITRRHFQLRQILADRNCLWSSKVEKKMKRRKKPEVAGAGRMEEEEEEEEEEEVAVVEESELGTAQGVSEGIGQRGQSRKKREVMKKMSPRL